MNKIKKIFLITTVTFLMVMNLLSTIIVTNEIDPEPWSVQVSEIDLESWSNNA